MFDRALVINMKAYTFKIFKTVYADDLNMAEKILLSYLDEVWNEPHDYNLVNIEDL